VKNNQSITQPVHPIPSAPNQLTNINTASLNTTNPNIIHFNKAPIDTVTTDLNPL
jgi:hypothetical protein